MLISITVLNATAEEIRSALEPIAKQECFELSFSPADAEMMTVEVNFEEQRDLTVLEAVSGVLAFLALPKEAL